MCEILKKIQENAKAYPDRIVYTVSMPGALDDNLMQLTWAELEDKSNRLANYLSSKSKTPIIVYGHKHPYMLVSFIACVKSGHAYVPIDSSFPIGRVQDIINAVKPEVILTTEDIEEIAWKGEVLRLEEIETIIHKNNRSEDPSLWVKSNEVYYIIFTSGSTGVPKGVQITAGCLDNFLRWAVTLGNYMMLDDGKCHTFINQAPFSFDLSVFDVYLTLYTGGTLWAISKKLLEDMDLLYSYLGQSNADVWVSTPSFAEIVLSDEKFTSRLLPQMKLFLFCGETLTNQTVQKLNCAFEYADVINTYGPTESTVAMTSVLITPEIRDKYNPLPIGVAKQGTYVYIMDENGKILNDGEKGEIVIVGDTVSIGYWNNDEKNAELFGSYEIDNTSYRLYHTHDKGYYKDGMLFYCGRIDLQIKLHGYRIELEDIESNILTVSNVERAIILPEYRNGEVVNLIAYIVSETRAKSDLKERQRIRVELKSKIPEYMIPKKFVFRDFLPVTSNGKVDRKLLEAMETC